MALKKFTKDPDAVLDYTINWAKWLPEGDQIVAVTTPDAEAGITVDSASFTATTTTVWVSGGSVGQTYKVPVHIETSGGREDDQTLEFRVREQ